MVDRDNRRRARALLKDLIDARITNELFDEAWPDGSADGDRALPAIGDVVWACYSDSEEHTFTGPYSLRQETRELLRRCLLFLDSDLEYEWPRSSIVYTTSRSGLLDWLTGGALTTRSEKRRQSLLQELEAAGDVGVWPFIRRSDYVRVHRPYDEVEGNS